MVKVPAKVRTGTPPEWALNCKVLVAVVQVKLLKVVELEPAMVEVAVVSKVIVPEEWVKVPLFVKLAATVKAAEFEATKVPEAAIVTEPFTSKTGSLVVILKVPVLVPLPTMRLLDTVMVPAMAVCVMLLAPGRTLKL